jgi:cytoskeletal protein RodZ
LSKLPSFGETLRRERELRGIDLRDVAEATKISVRFLQALESDRTDVLPGGLFPRAFVRQYASYLGLDPERTVAEYLFAASGQAVEPAPAASTPPKKPVRRGFLMALLAAAAVAFALAWPQVRTAEREQTAPPPASVTLLTPLPSLRVYPPPSSGPASPAPEATTGLVLDLQARQSCWVAVQADGIKVMDRVLAEGESQTLQARDEIVLSVGNAGGLAYKLNGRPGVVLGREGEVRRNIVITRQSVPSLLQDGPLPPA